MGSDPFSDVADVILGALGDLTSGLGVTGVDSAPILRDSLYKTARHAAGVSCGFLNEKLCSKYQSIRDRVTYIQSWHIDTTFSI